MTNKTSAGTTNDANPHGGGSPSAPIPKPKFDGDRLRQYMTAEADAFLTIYNQFATLVPSADTKGAAHRGEDGRFVETLLVNDIGPKAVTVPASAPAAAHVEEQLRDFIRRGVADALAGARVHLETLTTENVLRFVDGVYESAFEILRALGEAEDDG